MARKKKDAAENEEKVIDVVEEIKEDEDDSAFNEKLSALVEYAKKKKNIPICIINYTRNNMFDDIDKMNDYNETISEEMITFLLINSSGICVIPAVVMSVRNELASQQPTIIMPYIIVISSIVLIIMLLVDRVIRIHGKH